MRIGRMFFDFAIDGLLGKHRLVPKGLTAPAKQCNLRSLLRLKRYILAGEQTTSLNRHLPILSNTLSSSRAQRFRRVGFSIRCNYHPAVVSFAGHAKSGPWYEATRICFLFWEQVFK
ncbi:unnamed protein product [Clavelina lepadiformis]|uniref:Uncharacterized protein n=1 Tax=Clavelina lepadiformis TaxID=159417 RepID=A0ABP0F7V4_CLALP